MFQQITLPNGASLTFSAAPDASHVGDAQRAAAILASSMNALAGLVPQSFADDAARTAAIPAAVGQLGIQVDTGILYTGTALTAGSWAVIKIS